MSAPSTSRGWYSRGYVPHFDAGAVFQTVTFRLADSLPADALARWLVEVEQLPEEKRDPEVRRRIERYIDQGHGECSLRLPAVAEVVEGALLHFHEVRYHLVAWVVMPNHVHVLFRPNPECSLSQILHSWKSFTSNQSNRLLGRQGRFWHPDFFDRYIRDEEHFQRAWQYIENNPVKAGLCARPQDWRYGSARRRL